MKNIDFLPPRYRERHRRRQAFAWEIAIVSFFALLIAAGALWQVTQHWRASAQLLALQEQHVQAIEMQTRLQELQTRLSRTSESADLYLYLEHPWPRTQVLHALESCLPAGMTLTEVQMAYETQAAPPPVPPEEELQKLSPPRRDIARLRRESDHRVAVVKIAGSTSDAKLIYDFADRLGRLPLLASVKLEAAENHVSKALDQTAFRLRGILKPGYGQPGGPEFSLVEKQP